MSNAHDLTAVFGDLIFAYTRAQAIADGVLLDVSDRAQRFRIRFPVALTAGVYGAITQRALTDVCKQLCVDLLLLTMRQQTAALPAAAATDRLDFALKVPHLPPISLYAVCTPGDTPEPVITVMLPHED